ncbi:hypothetical protein D8I35_17400 [Corticibacter populi]|uniref:Uncharacterized protein n=1 Tax=Corticibacter populi TaxID=1550736 RepID=A0A3M6QIR7_9BURK|nr:hypothetical protein D8I35_17400 [Corticibacter populi]RZS33378.1 hypothetical protein EV687_1702 [Corticibacter populi]
MRPGDFVLAAAEFAAIAGGHWSREDVRLDGDCICNSRYAGRMWLRGLNYPVSGITKAAQWNTMRHLPLRTLVHRVRFP